MKLRLFDSATGLPAGDIEVPDKVLEAARLVERWMLQNGAATLKGLALRSGGQVAGKRAL